MARQVQVTTSEPWAPASPHLIGIMDAAQRLFQTGAGTDFFPGSTVVPFAPQTEAGLTALEDQASGGAPGLGAAYGAVGRGLTGFNPAIPALGARAYQSNPFYQAIGAAGSAPTTAGIDTLAATSGGANLFSPFLTQQFEQGADLIRNQMGSAFNDSGMYGSAAHRKNLEGGLGDLFTKLAAPAYQFERGLQEQAARDIAGFQQNDFGRAMQAAFGSADTFGQDAARQLSALSEMGNFWRGANSDALASAGMLPGLFQYGAMPADQLIRAGQAREEQAANYLDDTIQRFEQEENAPWAALDKYRAAIGELPLQGLGTQTTISKSKRSLF